jgi:hypothetical protein
MVFAGGMAVVVDVVVVGGTESEWVLMFVDGGRKRWTKVQKVASGRCSGTYTDTDVRHLFALACVASTQILWCLENT